eukprot:1989518-Prymnesium_polylepis.1
MPTSRASWGRAFALPEPPPLRRVSHRVSGSHVAWGESWTQERVDTFVRNAIRERPITPSSNRAAVKRGSDLFSSAFQSRLGKSEATVCHICGM